MYIIMKHILEWNLRGPRTYEPLVSQDKVNVWWCMSMDGQRKAFLESSCDLAVVKPLAAWPQYIYHVRWYGQAVSCTWTSPTYGHTEHLSHNGCVQIVAGVSRNCFEITWSQCKHNCYKWVSFITAVLSIVMLWLALSYHIVPGPITASCTMW